MSEQCKKVYQAISAVSADLLSGIQKDNMNQHQRFHFRGIDDIYNALAPALVSHKLIIAPRMTERTMIEKSNKSGGILFYVTVKADFDFISTEDGSSVTITTYGEAMDSSDKATNKAMSAAYKYAAIQAFCIPTVDRTIDTDAYNPEATYEEPVIEKIPIDDENFNRMLNGISTGRYPVETAKTKFELTDVQLGRIETAVAHFKKQG